MTHRDGCSCARPRWVRLAIVAGTCLPASPVVADLDTLYWTDRGDGTICRAALDGTGLETLITNLPGPQGIGVDPIGARIYWADSTLQRISRANLDGSNVEVVLDGSGQFIPVGLAIDASARLVYWSDPVFGRIQRAPLDAGSVESFQTGLASPQDVSVDPILARVYWAEGSAGIRHAPSSGGPPASLVLPFTGSATVVAQAPLPCQVVWRAANRLTRADCLGLGTEDLVIGPGNVVGLVVHPDTGAVYWSDADAGTIRRLEEGAPGDEVVIAGLAMPWRMALGPREAPPTIVMQPLSQAVQPNDVAGFSVEAIGTQPLAYAWRRDGVALVDGAHVSGSATPSLSVIATHADTGLYDCLVSNTDGAAASNPVALAVRFCPGGAGGAIQASGASACVADMDGDCDADIFDFTLFSGAFGAEVDPGAPGDFDCDGIISVFDFAIFSAQLGCDDEAP